MSRRSLTRCALISFAAAMASMSPQAGEAAPQPLQLEQFFLGHLKGNGTAQDIEHGVRTVNFSGTGARTSDGMRVTFDTVFSDGERKHIVWTFVRLASGSYVGHRDDLVGDAQINQNGPDVKMNYSAKVGTASGAKAISFDEHFTLVGPGTITDHLSGSLLFINVASGDMTIHKVSG